MNVADPIAQSHGKIASESNQNLYCLPSASFPSHPGSFGSFIIRGILLSCPKKRTFLLRIGSYHAIIIVKTLEVCCRKRPQGGVRRAGLIQKGCAVRTRMKGIGSGIDFKENVVQHRVLLSTVIYF
jgi:hypothetical protein